MSQVTVATSGQGSQLYVKISGIYTEIPQLKNLNGPGMASDIADVSCLSSPGGFKEKKPLMKDPTTLTADLIWDPGNAAHDYLRKSNAAYPSALEDFIEIASDTHATTCRFQGYVTKFDPKYSAQEVLMVSLEVTPTGEPHLYFGSSPA